MKLFVKFHLNWTEIVLLKSDEILKETAVR